MSEERRAGMEEMQRDLREVWRKVDELHVVLYKNGFTKNVKRLADTLEGLHERVVCLEKDLNDHIITRELTCPVIRGKKETKERARREQWIIIGLAFTGCGTILTFVTLLLRISGIL